MLYLPKRRTKQSEKKSKIFILTRI